MSSHSRISRRWQCPQCGLNNTGSSHNCIACFKSRYPSNFNNVNNGNYRCNRYNNNNHNNYHNNNRRPDKRVIIPNNNVPSVFHKSSNIRPSTQYFNPNNHTLSNNTSSNTNNNNNNNNKVFTLKSSISRPRPSSLHHNLYPSQPMKISDCIYKMSVILLSGYIRSEIDEYLYPESDLILLINLYLSDGALYRCYFQQNEWIMNNGLKLISSIGGYSINGKGIAIIGFNINARNRHLLYEWTVNVRTFNPPDSFIGIIANSNTNSAIGNISNTSNESYPDSSFDYAQSQYCNGIGGERHRVYRMGKLDRKIKYKSGWHCNNVSHWNDNYDIVKCRYDGRYRQLSFTKFIRNTQKFKLICTIQLPSQLPNNIHSWCPAIYLGHISDSCTVQY